jgi:23S rRNA pseudouridine1911/1915/1917 synthase
MADPPLTILYEDNHLLVLLKPAGLPTMGVRTGQPSLVAVAKDYLKRKYHKPGAVYLGIVSRLDAPVSGVVVLARTSKAAARLTDQFRRGAVDKTYWALVEGAPEAAAATCIDWLRKDDRRAKMVVMQDRHPDAKEARLSYRTLRVLRRAVLLEVKLQTGRKHQIRVQLAHRGHPILGDRKYGAQTEFPRGIALHARRLELVHPVRKTPLELSAPLPRAWARFGVREPADEITAPDETAPSDTP